MSLLLASSSASTWVLIGILVALLVVWVVLGATRRKKDEASRRTLESQIVPGARVKTYSGLYGTVVSITETTDGKIVLLKTGEGNNVSYQNLHINAIYGLDTKAIVTYDTEGNLVEPAATTPAAPAEEKPAEPKQETKPKKVTTTPKADKTTLAAKEEKEEKAEEPKKKEEPKQTKTTAATKKTTAKKTTKPAATKTTKTTK